MTSSVDNYETPRWLFNKLNDIFKFNLDIAADDKNHLCSWYFTAENSALTQPWIDPSRYDNCARVKRVAYCNPPYKLGGILPWFKKFKEEYEENDWTIVTLTPSRTDTRWFNIIWDVSKYVIFLKGRLKFTLGGKEIGTATFPSAISIFSSEEWDLSSMETLGKVIKLR